MSDHRFAARAKKIGERFTYTTGEELSVDGIASSRNGPDEPNRGAGENPQALVDDRAKIGEFDEVLVGEVLILGERRSDFRGELVEDAAVAEELVEQSRQEACCGLGSGNAAKLHLAVSSRT